jgi:hypothetical protein
MGRGVATVPYYAHVRGRIGVLEAPDDPMFIGEATCVGQNENGLAVWKLVINGKPIKGWFVIIDGEFRLEQ